MDENNEKSVLEKTILDTGIAKPISVTKEEALNMAKQAEEANKVVNKQPENIASAIPITKEELDEQKVNELNDLMKNDYVKVVEVHHSKKTYIILFLYDCQVVSKKLLLYSFTFYISSFSCFHYF